MSENNFSDLFQQIENTVQDIAHSKSISDLKSSIDQTVQEVKQTVKSTAKYYTSGNATNYKSGASGVGSSKTTYRAPDYSSSSAPSSPGSSGCVKTKNNRVPAVPEKLALPANKLPGHVSGWLLTIAGVSCSIISGLVALITLLSSNWSGGITGVLPGLIWPTAFIVLGVGVSVRGASLCARAARYRKYLRELRGISFCTVKELAEAVKENTSYVAKDLQKMIDRRYFREGHLDAKKTTFMLDQETYQHYLQLEQKTQQEKTQQAARAANPELDATIREGTDCIKKIREANDAIPGVVISEKLDRLETVVTKIFDFMEKHPERLGEIRRFTSYYLPTTLKLVSAYREFDAQEIQGETVLASKKEIEDTLDIINQSFETMFDNFFEHDARDVSADISVLHTMLQQEGLEEDELTRKK